MTHYSKITQVFRKILCC